MSDPQNWQPPADDRPAVPAYGEYHPSGYQPQHSPSQPASQGWAPPPKPGLIPLRPLGFGTLLWAPFQVLRRNPKPTFGSALLVQGVVTLISLVVVGAVGFVVMGRITSATVEEREAIEAGAILTIILAALVPAVLSLVASALLQGVIVTEVARATLGEKLRLGPLWRAVKPRLWTLVLWTLLLVAVGLVAAALITGLVVLFVVMGQEWVPLAVAVGVIGGLAFIAGAVWVGTKVSLVPSVIVLEELPIRRAVSRSWMLTNGYFWRTFGVQFLVAAIVNIVTQIVTTPISLIFGVAVSVIDPNAALNAVIPSIILYGLLILITLVMAAVASVVQSATGALIYIDLRMRKEGLDLELARFVESSASARGATDDPYQAAGHPGVAPNA